MTVYPWHIYCFSIVQVEGQLAKRLPLPLPLPTNEIGDTRTAKAKEKKNRRKNTNNIKISKDTLKINLKLVYGLGRLKVF